MFGEFFLTSSNSRYGVLPGASSTSVSSSRADMENRKMNLSSRNYPVSVWIYESIAYVGSTICSSSTTIRRRFHSRRNIMTYLSTCFFTIILYHFMISTVHSLTRSRRSVTTSISDRYLSEAMRGSVNETSNFTQHLWLFKNSDAERIYLYTKLLREHKWDVNEKYMQLFRDEINQSPNVSLDYLVMTQDNVQIGEEIPPYVFIKTLWPSGNFVVDEKFWSRLPRRSPIGDKRYGRCAVVGNSGSLKNASCGKEIDGMDFVFRCNGAPLEEFHNDAGLRTDFITFNPSILFKHFGGLMNDSMVDIYVQYMNQYHSIVWYPCFGSNKVIEPCLQAMSYRDRIGAKLVIGHPTHYSNVWDFWTRRGLKKKPSTGLYMMNVALAMCDEVHLYGFWPFPVVMSDGAGGPGQDRRQSFAEIPYHYFNNLPFTSKYHNTDLEFRILVQLHMLGVINLHAGTCPS